MDTERVLRHDARNFINSLRLNVEALRWAESDEERLECLDAIEQVADEAGAWVDRYERHAASAAASNG
jgi:hypothetical protein